MSDYLPARLGGARAVGLDRRAARAVEQISAGVSLERARVRSQEEVEAMRIEALGAITAAAIVETANISAVEAAMFERAPHAGARLQFVADSGARAIASTLTAAAREIR